MSKSSGVLVATALVALVAGASCGVPASSAAKRSHPAALSSVDQRSTPPDWVAVPYGDVQVSVPKGSVLTSACPSRTAPASVFLGAITQAYFCYFVPSTVSTLYLEPPERPYLWTTSQRPVRINGIVTYTEPYGSPTMGGYQVPSLGVQLRAIGPLASRILSTLTRSPRAVALAPGPPPTVPGSWRHVVFGGLGLAVPPRWTVDHASNWPPSVMDPCSADGGNLPARTLLLDKGTSEVLEHCPAISQITTLRQATDGVLVDPGKFSSLDVSPIYGSCFTLGQLRACPFSGDDYAQGQLFLAVYLPGIARPVAVEIGLAGSGMTAKTILRSIRVS